MEPTGASLVSYRLGFGDCFLLRVEYGTRARHLLIDFGSASPASKAIGDQQLEVAKDISRRTGGRLEAVVASHRHRDHVSGFGGRSGRIIAGLRPRLAILPWTEHPAAARDPGVAPSGTRTGIGALSAAHARALDDMQAIAAAAQREVRRRAGVTVPGDGEDDWSPEPAPIGSPFGKGLAQQVEFLAEVNGVQAEAMASLRAIPARDHVALGSRTRLGKLFPGVRAHVLGPPTLAQAQALSPRSRDPGELWHLLSLAGGASRAGRGPFSHVRSLPQDGLPLETRWFLKRLDGVRAEELLQLVRALDRALDETSVILLLEVCGKKLLFPGDARAGSWACALADPATRRLLAGVDLYKVGHHGGPDATPRSLWSLFEKRGRRGAGRLRTVLSTRRGKHGSVERGTEVPSRSLLRALESESRLFATDALRTKKELCHEERIA